MPELFADDIRSVQVPCSNCGTVLEIANTGLNAFESPESVLCLECLVRGDVPAGGDIDTVTLPLQERIAIIDEVVNSFSLHLRNVLIRSVKADLTWNSEYGFESWGDSSDALASAHAPGIWYGMRPRSAQVRS